MSSERYGDPTGRLAGCGSGVRDRNCKKVGAAARSSPNAANRGSLPGMEASESHQLLE